MIGALLLASLLGVLAQSLPPAGANSMASVAAGSDLCSEQHGVASDGFSTMSLAAVFARRSRAGMRTGGLILPCCTAVAPNATCDCTCSASESPPPPEEQQVCASCSETTSPGSVCQQGDDCTDCIDGQGCPDLEVPQMGTTCKVDCGSSSQNCYGYERNKTGDPQGWVCIKTPAENGLCLTGYCAKGSQGHIRCDTLPPSTGENTDRFCFHTPKLSNNDTFAGVSHFTVTWGHCPSTSTNPTTLTTTVTTLTTTATTLTTTATTVTTTVTTAVTTLTTTVTTTVTNTATNTATTLTTTATTVTTTVTTLTTTVTTAVTTLTTTVTTTVTSTATTLRTTATMLTTTVATLTTKVTKGYHQSPWAEQKQDDEQQHHGPRKDYKKVSPHVYEAPYQSPWAEQKQDDEQQHQGPRKVYKKLPAQVSEAPYQSPGAKQGRGDSNEQIVTVNADFAPNM